MKFSKYLLLLFFMLGFFSVSLPSMGASTYLRVAQKKVVNTSGGFFELRPTDKLLKANCNQYQCAVKFKLKGRQETVYLKPSELRPWSASYKNQLSEDVRPSKEVLANVRGQYYKLYPSDKLRLVSCNQNTCTVSFKLKGRIEFTDLNRNGLRSFTSGARAKTKTKTKTKNKARNKVKKTKGGANKTIRFASPTCGCKKKRGCYVTSNFGLRTDPVTGKKNRMHRGIDVGGGYHTPIVAAESGFVEFAGSKGGYGKTIVINHQRKGFKTLYAHLRRIKVRSGWVTKGDIIGTMGSTGKSTGPHLHFEIQQNGKKLNPKRFTSFKTSKISKTCKVIRREGRNAERGNTIAGAIQ